MEYKIILSEQDTYKWEHPSHLTKEYLEKFSVGKVFVETGTYLGDTVRLALDFGFEKVHSVELNKELYDNAVEMFKDDDRVKIWHGDSADVLLSIVKEIGNEPATFWLDAHASGPLTGGKSGGTPVVDELKSIGESSYKEHTIFVDDTRLFGSSEWSFVKLESAIEEITKINPAYKIYQLDGHAPKDVLCVTMKG